MIDFKCLSRKANLAYFEDGDLFPEWIKVWIEIAEACIQTSKKLAIWSRSTTTNWLGHSRTEFLYQEFRWKQFVYSFDHDSWCNSGLLVNPDSLKEPRNCDAIVFTLEAGLGIRGSLPAVKGLLAGYEHVLSTSDLGDD